MVSPLSPPDDKSSASLSAAKTSRVAGHSWSKIFSRNLSYVIARVMRMFSRLFGVRPAVEADDIRLRVTQLKEPGEVPQKVAKIFEDLQNRPYDISASEAKELRKRAVEKLVEAKDPKALVDLLKGSSDQDEKAIWQEAYDQLLSDYWKKGYDHSASDKPVERDMPSYALLMENARLRYGDTEEGNNVIWELLRTKADSLMKSEATIEGPAAEKIEKENKQLAFRALEDSKGSFYDSWAKLIGVFSKAKAKAQEAFDKEEDPAKKEAAQVVLKKARDDLKAVETGYSEATGRDVRLPRMRMELASLSVGLHGNKFWDEADAINGLAKQAEKPNADVKALGKAWQKMALEMAKKHPDMPEGLKKRLLESYKEF